MNQPQQSTFFEYGINRNQIVYSLDDVPVTGTIPTWLSGSYIRNGPGMFNLQHRRMNHWFDAMGALHKFDLHNGKVSYQCRFIECESFRHATATGDLKFSEFATDPCKSLFKKVQSYVFPTLPNMTDNPKINVARIGDKWMALGETPMQVEFDPETLRTIGVSEPVPGAFAYKTTAHPHFEDEHAYNLVVKFGMQSHYRIYDVSRPGEKALASVPVRKPAYLHGFGMSSKYFIIAAGPLVVVPIELLFWKRPYIENHKWLPGEGATIWVIEKVTGKLKAKFKTEPFFAFHHVNAWEEGDELVMDINAYNDASIVQKYYLRELEQPEVELPFGTLRRFRLNLATKKYSSSIVSEACIELPRIDYQRYNTNGDYGFTYGVSLHPGHRKGFYNSLVKINVKTGKADYWHQPGCYPGEPYFFPSPGSKNDEDGVLLSIVLDAGNGNSFLLVLNAATLQETGRATLPEPVVYGFHGEFMSNK
ncbi:MAG TPA: carotenoid oxygenase family protein [Lacibacter sp.]|nr:carotenoid oxygenase family protein [Lacibacter sp.]HMO89129.1 carotenoid oxygenase family protein [Lacibacter sp.]HMP86616.1 carotenoid oxygenase family protein [Lacibacter sp.]